ncbi:diacylglycerol/lipid kinase family protein [Haloferula chungangensis]|uniref:Diacylglycerol/lipid kinase family protein n=1 Tax=Haloferula chungangensis TaxID=1048331 RepID=A0ABW2L8Y5_9BACT
MESDAGQADLEVGSAGGAERRKLLIIVNPVAGQDDGRDVEARLRSAANAAGLDYDLKVTRGEGDAMRWAQEACRGDRVIVSGGDGTVMEVITGLVKSKSGAGLAQIPTGTANLLARALSIPTEFDEALEFAFGDGVVVATDVGYLPGFDRYFALVAGAGWDAELIKDASRELKDRLGFFAYVLTGIRNLFGLRNSNIRLTVDDEVHQFRAHTVMVINVGEIHDVGIAIGPDVNPHDGRLDLAIMAPRSAWGIVKLVVRLLTKRFGNDDDLSYFSATHFKIEADPPLKLEVDGEYVGSTPFEVEVIPKGVHLLVPQRYAEDKGLLP